MWTVWWMVLVELAQIMPHCPAHLVRSGESQNNPAVLYSSATDRSGMYAEMVGHREILVLPKTESQTPPASRDRLRKPVALLPVDKRCLHIHFCRFPNTSLPLPSPWRQLLFFWSRDGRSKGKVILAARDVFPWKRCAKLTNMMRFK